MKDDLVSWLSNTMQWLGSNGLDSYLIYCKIWRFSWQWLWRMPSSWMWRHADLVITDVSEERIASIIRVESICSSETLVLTRVTQCRLSYLMSWSGTCYPETPFVLYLIPSIYIFRNVERFLSSLFNVVFIILYPVLFCAAQPVLHEWIHNKTDTYLECQLRIKDRFHILLCRLYKYAIPWKSTVEISSNQIQKYFFFRTTVHQHSWKRYLWAWSIFTSGAW
jgi:hypothetical protein